MNHQKTFFILSLIGIILLLFISQTQKPILSGKVNTIKQSTNKITLTVFENKTEIILFTNKVLNLNKQNMIEVYGSLEVYKNKTQIIAEKIKCLDC